VSAANEILARYQHIVQSLTLTTGSKGVFDVAVDGDIIYSKAETGRHAERGEVLDLFVDKYGQGVTPYGQE
jgi:predicted Rdx family selenoprotein